MGAESNWRLPTITQRDHFPSPIDFSNPYVPANSSAISDLFDFFDSNVGSR
jgi:phospholipase C